MEATNYPAPRTTLNLDVTFKKNYARQISSGILKNISLTGAFLDCSLGGFRIGEKLQLTFQVAERERKITATVVWVNNEGCGVKFHPTSQRDVQIVDDLIYFVENDRSGKKTLLDGIFKKVS